VGSTVTYTAFGAQSYNWAGGTTTSVVTYTPSASGTYTVSGTSNGCTSTVKTATVTVNNLPAVSITPFTGPVCDNGGLQGLSGTPAGGTFSGTGVTGASFDPSIGAGTYPVYYTYTDGNNCTGVDSMAAVVQTCIGIAKNGDAALLFYPNPAADEFFVKFSRGNNMAASGELIDVLGNTVQKRTAEVSGASSLLRFDLSALSPGVYFVRARYSGKTQVIKLIHK
jgi:hypothetical protein